jgi:hypothetical protein
MKSQRRLNSQDDVEFVQVLVLISGTDESELVWSIVINKEEGIYQLENVPYKSKEFAMSDIIFAEFDEFLDKLVYKYTIEPSGNGSIRVDLLDQKIDPWDFQGKLREYGFFGETNRSNDFRFCINVEPNNEDSLKKLLLYLDILAANGNVNYELIGDLK